MLKILQHLAVFASVAEAWYCDSVSILRKLLQARENGVGKAAFWVLGAEDPRLWEMLEDFPVPFVSSNLKRF